MEVQPPFFIAWFPKHHFQNRLTSRENHIYPQQIAGWSAHTFRSDFYTHFAASKKKVFQAEKDGLHVEVDKANLRFPMMDSRKTLGMIYLLIYHEHEIFM